MESFEPISLEALFSFWPAFNVDFQLLVLVCLGQGRILQVVTGHFGDFWKLDALNDEIGTLRGLGIWVRF